MSLVNFSSLINFKRHYSDPTNRDTSNMRRVEEEINELQGIMINNIGTVASSISFRNC